MVIGPEANYPLGEKLIRLQGGVNDTTEGDFANEIASISACPPSCAEMEEMLRQIPRGFDADLPHLKMFETAKMVLFHSFDLSARSRCTFFGRYLTSLIYIFCCSW